MEENKKTENPQAFPQEWTMNGTTDNWENGMSLRDYFAAKAMNGYMSASLDVIAHGMQIDAKTISEESYKIADEMLKQRTS